MRYYRVVSQNDFNKMTEQIYITKAFLLLTLNYKGRCGSSSLRLSVSDFCDSIFLGERLSVNFSTNKIHIKHLPEMILGHQYMLHKNNDIEMLS